MATAAILSDCLQYWKSCVVASGCQIAFCVSPFLPSLSLSLSNMISHSRLYQPFQGNDNTIHTVSEHEGLFQLECQLKALCVQWPFPQPPLDDAAGCRGALRLQSEVSGQTVPACQTHVFSTRKPAAPKASLSRKWLSAPADQWFTRKIDKGISIFSFFQSILCLSLSLILSWCLSLYFCFLSYAKSSKVIFCHLPSIFFSSFSWCCHIERIANQVTLPYGKR